MKKNKRNWKYVITEIVIVSIGILIAFSINTFSSSLSKRHEVKEYKKSMMTDLEENIKNLDRIIQVQEQKVNELTSVVKGVELQNFQVDSLRAILFRQRKSPTFFPVSGTFKTMVSQGNIEIFNTTVKRELFNLYDTNYERTVYNGRLYDKAYVDIYDTEIQRVMNLRTKKIDHPDRLKTEEFLKNIILIIDEAKSYLNLLYTSRTESDKMLMLLKSKKRSR